MTDGADGGERTMPVPTSPRRGHLVTWGGNGIEGCLEKEGLLHLDALTRLLGDDASRGGQITPRSVQVYGSRINTLFPESLL
jgi:hypothetical protein